MTEDEVLQARLIADYKAVFISERGQEVLKDLASECFLDQETLDPERPHLTSFNEGKRSVIIGILGKLNISILNFLQAEVIMEDF